MRKVEVTPGRRFVIQGVLVLLPLVLLTAMAVSWLRQDQYAVKESAKQVAKLAVKEVARRVTEQISSLSGPNSSSAQTNLVRFTLGESGQLLSPVPRDRFPVPQPYPVEELALATSSLWKTAVTVGDSNGWRAFLAVAPSPEWRALAEYHLALSISKEDPEESSRLLKAIFDRSIPVRLDSGLPLVPLAGWRWMQMNSNLVTGEFLHRFCSNAVAHPSFMTGSFLSAATCNQGGPMKQWHDQWHREETARRLFAANDVAWKINGNREIRWLNLDGADWLVASRGSNVTAFSWSDVTGLIDNQIKEAEAPFVMLQAKLAGRVIADPLTKIKGLGRNVADDDLETLAVGVESEGEQTIEITAYLWQNEAYWAQQRRRLRMLSAVIVLALGAALVGLVSAWKTFQQQWQLSEMKSNFVSSVSHELRAPLASVRLMAESLERGKVPEESRRQEYFQLIGRECRRLTSLIENVLDFARIDQGRKQYQPEPTDLAALARHTVKSMEAYAGEREVRLELTVEGETGDVTLDGQAIQQALVNLIDNAVKHSPKHGTVKVRLEFAVKTVLVSVTDSGPGIPKREQEKIFERFYRRGTELRRETQGVGIGLSIVKHVTEAHGGRVIVESEEGKGSTFRIELPRAI